MSQRRFVEHRMQREREAEAQRMGVSKMLREQSILAGHSASALKVEAKRVAREHREESAELRINGEYVRNAQEARQKKEMLEMEVALANELERRHAKKVREEQNVKRICEGSEELQQLKKNLHAAQMNKQRAVQIAEKTLTEEKLALEEAAICDIMNKELKAVIEAEEAVEHEKLKARIAVKKLQQAQITEKEALREEALRQYELERSQVQQVVDKIREEDELEEAMMRQKQRETREHLRRFDLEQAQNRKEQERRDREEMEKIEAYAQAKRDREAALEAERQAIEEEKKRILNSMIGAQEEKNKEAEELEYLRNELIREELEAEHLRKEEEANRKRIEDRVEMLRAYETQIQQKEAKRREEEEAEEEFRKNLMAKFAMDDKIEQMNDQRRRMKLLEHKREVERFMTEKRLMYEEERKREREEYQRMVEDAKDRKEIIEKERQRLLREYGKDLKDYLPKGTLERPSDRAFLE